MKIKGRLIATLAALGLLIAMLPIGPASAAVGAVGIAGGADDEGKFFSDKTGNNIVTLSVTDPDLSPARVGKARFSSAGQSRTDALTFDLTDDPGNTNESMVLAGEKNKTDDLDGTRYPATYAVDPYDDDTAFEADSAELTTHLVEVEAQLAIYVGLATKAKEDLTVEDIANMSKTFHYLGADGLPGGTETNADEFIVTLSEEVRDRDGSASANAGEVSDGDISVVLDGQNREAEVQYILGGTLDANGDGTTVELTNRYVRLLAAGGVPAQSTDNISITYMYSEFNQEDSSATPITLSGTRVRYGTSFNALNSEVTASNVTSGMVTTTGMINLETNAAVEIQFVYNVKERAAEVVTVTSNTSIAGGQNLTLDGAETTPDSSKFEEKIAVFENSDYSKIVNEASNLTNANDDDKGVQVSELCASNALGNASNEGSLCDRVMKAAAMVMSPSNTPLTALQLGTTKATDLVKLLLPVADKDTLTVVYADESPSATITKAAEIDLAAPVVTLISPAQGIYTSESLLTLSAEVVDEGSGVTQNKIQLVHVNSTTGLNLNQANTLRSPIANGYRVSNVPSSAISEGKKQWAIQVVDNVGNEPLKEDKTPAVTADDGTVTKEAVLIRKAALGAVGAGEADSRNAFVFYVDTTGPTVASAKTGVYLKNPGVTTGEIAGKEAQKINNRNWIRVSFGLGDGTAPLDVSTVSTSDFLVDGAEPTDLRINAAKHDADAPGGPADKGSAVYLNVGQLDTDARPKVVLVGEVRDRAGNIRTEGTINSSIDGLAPIVTVTPSVDISADEVTVAVASSERLGLNPIVQVTTEEPVKGEELVSPDALTIALDTGTFTKWSGTQANPAGAAAKWYVVVKASDQNGNEAVIGDADSSNGGASPSEDDVVSFQLDDSEPGLKFMSSTGADLSDSKTKPEEGAVWVVAQFDEDEHADDKYRKVNVTDMTLKVTDGEDVTTDIAMLFGDDAEIDCPDHDNSEMTDKCVNITLAVILAPNAYTYTITGVDSVGNDVTKSVEFTVVEAKAFELDLKPGVNLVSIPGMARDDGGMLDVALADAPVSTVLTYDGMAAATGGNPWLTSIKDPETGVFSGDITMLEPGKAYFITSAASYTVKVKLESAGGLPPTIAVRQGYNAIGFVSISGATETDIELYLNSIGWSVAYRYDPTPGRGWEVIRKGESTEDDMIPVRAGEGLLVYATYDSTLTP